MPERKHFFLREVFPYPEQHEFLKNFRLSWKRATIVINLCARCYLAKYKFEQYSQKICKLSNWSLLVFASQWKVFCLLQRKHSWTSVIFRLSRKRSRGSAKKELNLASILVCIVVVFLLCNIPRVFINCYEFLCSENIVRWASIQPGQCADWKWNCSDNEEMSPPLWILCFTSFNHLALVFNASVNFLIYFSCGNAFKQTLLKLVRVLPDLPRVTKPPDPSENPITTEIK